jgi:hypothetical protein
MKRRRKVVSLPPRQVQKKTGAATLGGRSRVAAPSGNACLLLLSSLYFPPLSRLRDFRLYRFGPKKPMKAIVNVFWSLEFCSPNPPAHLATVVPVQTLSEPMPRMKKGSLDQS